MPELSQHPAIIIPAYQPDEKLLILIQTLRTARPAQRIIVVNDGSSPEKQALFAQLPSLQVEVLHHRRNLGKGRALKTAFAHYLNLAGSQALGVVTADADGQHTVEDILALSDALAVTADRLHLGVRNFALADIPWRSKIGNVLTGYFFRRISKTTLYDTQTGLRGIPASLIEVMVHSHWNGYEMETEMLLIAANHRIELNQIQIQTIYFDRNAQSHFNPLRDSWRVIRVFVYFLLGLRKPPRV